MTYGENVTVERSAYAREGADYPPEGVTGELERLEQSIAVLDETLGRLAMRVGPVLRSEEPTINAEGKVAVPNFDPASPVRTRVSTAIHQIHALQGQANALIGRVDL